MSTTHRLDRRQCVRVILGLTWAIVTAPVARADPADEHFRKGLELYEKAQDRQAIVQFNFALGKNPRHAEAYAQRGKCYEMLGNKSQALRDWETAIRIDPKCAEAFNHRARLFERMGELARALDDFNWAVEAKPGDAKYWYNRGTHLHLFQAPKREKDALSDLNKAIELNPKKAIYYNARSSIREGLNDLKGALADANAGLDVDSMEPFCRANKAWYLHRLGQAVDAQRELTFLARSGDRGRELARQTSRWIAELERQKQSGQDRGRGCSRCGTSIGPSETTCSSCRYYHQVTGH